MQQAKERIKQIVEAYINLFPEDYATVCDGIKLTRNTYADDFASAKKHGAPDMRALFEIPVDLSEMFIMQLSEEEMEWFKAGGSDRKAGGRWFAKTFKEFALPTNI